MLSEPTWMFPPGFPDQRELVPGAEVNIKQVSGWSICSPPDDPSPTDEPPVEKPKRGPRKKKADVPESEVPAETPQEPLVDPPADPPEASPTDEPPVDAIAAAEGEGLAIPEAAT